MIKGFRLLFFFTVILNSLVVFSEQGLINVPLPVTNNSARSIVGKVLLVSEYASIPLRHQKLYLIKGNKPLLKSMTDNEGNFLFVGIIKEGRYILRLNSQKFIGETAITVGLFNISGIEIFAYNIKKEKK